MLDSISQLWYFWIMKLKTSRIVDVDTGDVVDVFDKSSLLPYQPFRFVRDGEQVPCARLVSGYWWRRGSTSST